MKTTLRNVGLMFVLGFFVGPIGDFCHVLSETTGYPQDAYAWYFPGGVPWWVPFLFASATLSIGVTHPIADRLIGPHGAAVRPGARSWAMAWAGVAAFVGLYCVSGYLPFGDKGWNDLVLAVAATAIWAWLDRTWQGAVLGWLTAIAGTAVEITLVRNEVFFYQERAADLYGVATWLPWLYVAASVAVGNFARRLAAPPSVSPAR
jgi:hypothetical protein